MNYPPFPIPKGTLPIPDGEIDHRSAVDIVASLKTYAAPTASEKNVWAYWHTGWDSMPPWCQRNVIDWVRRLGPSWTVRVLDSVEDSPMNVTRFIGREFLPDAFNTRTMTGRYMATHSADLIRLPLLLLYGGVWMDVGIILIRNLDDIWNILADPSSPYEFAAFAFECRPGKLSVINPWLAARKGCALVKRWHDTFVHVWGTSTECTNLSQHPLLCHLEPYQVGGSSHKPIDKDKISGEVAKLMDYGTQVLCLERLRDLVDASDGWNGRDYLDKKAYLLPGLTEMWYYQLSTKFLGTKQFELLNTRYDAPESERSEAENYVQDLLSNTMLLKLCHGAGVMQSNLADIWDDPKQRGADSAPGTFAEFLRWGSVHLSQTRELLPTKLTPLSHEPYHAHMFDPFEHRK
ncbi:hypothetical protein ZTR_07520 [Talaromyces verruculosus]|nr:hypothetical protein ZTR_07520 [Talaromyces verruculosus]